MKAEAEPVPVENREHCIEVGKIQIIRNGHGRITIGLTLRRTARRISRLKGTFEFIPSAYALEADRRVAAALREYDVCVKLTSSGLARSNRGDTS